MPPEGTAAAAQGPTGGGLVAREALTFRSLNENARSVSFIASTDALDSYEEIVEQDWDLTRFKTNPIILFGHNSRILPIGKATRCEVVSGKLEADIEIATAAQNPEAEYVWQCLKGGLLRAVSVGFVPKTVKYEKRDGKDVYVLSQNVLHEISVVCIPANPEALAKMKSKARDDAKAHAAPTPDTPQERGEPAAGKPKAMSYSVIAATLGMPDAQNATEAQVITHAKSLKERADRAEVHERSLTDTSSKLTASEKAHEAARVELAEAKSKLAEAETREKAHAVKAKADALKIVDLELNELVGKKILPTEKEGLLEIFEESPALYVKQLERVKGRADLGLTDAASKFGTGKTDAAPVVKSGAGGQAFADYLAKQD